MLFELKAMLSALCCGQSWPGWLTQLSYNGDTRTVSKGFNSLKRSRVGLVSIKTHRYTQKLDKYNCIYSKTDDYQLSLPTLARFRQQNGRERDAEGERKSERQDERANDILKERE